MIMYFCETFTTYFFTCAFISNIRDQSMLYRSCLIMQQLYDLEEVTFFVLLFVMIKTYL